MHIITGTFSMHPRGFGFVVPLEDDGEISEVFIPKKYTQNAINGDTVEVEVSPTPAPGKGPDGRIVHIVKRGRENLTGIVEEQYDKKNYYVHSPSIGTTREIVCQVKPKTKLKPGDHVTMRVTDWGEGQDDVILCDFVDCFGNIEDPSLDIKAAMLEFELRATFPKEAVEEAIAFGTEVKEEDKKGRVDLTGLETFTIDPLTAKDFDDALSLSKSKKGYKLHIHIADVSHYVTEGSAIDLEAQERLNSTYFPGSCLPMLPPELSDNLCSLKERVDRLAVTVELDIDLDGGVQKYLIYRSVINSNKRFTYEEAKEVLDGAKKSPHAPTLNLMVEVCGLFKKIRNARGSVDLGLPEVSILVDKKGQPYDFHISEYDITHQMVEEFMLKANEIVATHLSKDKRGLIYRVHEEPAQDKLDAFYSLARLLGFHLSPEPSQEEVQQVFAKAGDTPAAFRLAIGFVKSMKLAIYSEQNVGHYGLSLEYYTHFTSPIRRYCDTVIHRLLFDKGSKPNLSHIAARCSETERTSFKAESHVKLLKKLRLLDVYFSEDPNRHYAATVSEVKPFGFAFELDDLHLEGFIHVSKMRKDYYVYNQQTATLKGERSGRLYQVGSPIKVCLESLDLVFKETDWSLIR